MTLGLDGTNPASKELIPSLSGPKGIWQNVLDAIRNEFNPVDRQRMGDHLQALGYPDPIITEDEFDIINGMYRKDWKTLRIVQSDPQITENGRFISEENLRRPAIQILMMRVSELLSNYDNMLRSDIRPIRKIQRALLEEITTVPNDDLTRLFDLANELLKLVSTEPQFEI